MQLPALRAGEWSYQRSVVSPDAPQPKISEGRRCGSPSVQVRANITALKARHCTFSAIEHDAKRYSWSSSCPVGDEVLQMRSVLTVKGDELYRVVVEAQQGHHLPVHTVTVGRWIGECHSPNLPRRRLPFVLSPQPSSPIAAPPAPTAAPAAPSSSTP